MADRAQLRLELWCRVIERIEQFRTNIVTYSEIDKPKLFNDMLELLKDVATYVKRKTEVSDTASVAKLMDHFCRADFAQEYREEYMDVIKSQDSDRL